MSSDQPVHYARIRSGDIVSVLVILTATACLFAYTVKIRSPWFGALALSHHQYQTADTLKNAKSWYREGPWNLLFANFYNPGSIEFPTLASRDYYATYPPGCIVAIYLAGLISGHEPAVSTAMAYNLANHFFIALFLSLTVFVFLRQLGLGPWVCLGFSLVPVLLELLLPGPIYWHQSTFFADEAILLPFVLFVFLEVARYSVKERRWLDALDLLQAAVMFYGFLTDWLFFFVALVVFCKRLVESGFGPGLSRFLARSIRFWSGGVLAMSLYAVQVYLLGGFSQVMTKFLRRSSFLSGEVPLDLHPAQKFSVFDVFWGHHIPYSFGKPAAVLLLANLGLLLLIVGILAYRYRVKGQEATVRIRRTAWLIAMFLVPCFMQVYFLKQHTLIHLFSALKFSLPLAVVPLVLTPVLLLFLIEDLGPASNSEPAERRFITVSSALPFLMLSCLFLAGAYVYAEHPRYAKLFPQPDLSLETIGNFISTNTVWNDVVFSPHFQVPEKPPEWLAYTMKRVYLARSMEDVTRKLRSIEGEYVADFFVIADYERTISPEVKAIIAKAESVKQQGPLKLYKISKKRFLALTAK